MKLRNQLTALAMFSGFAGIAATCPVTFGAINTANEQIVENGSAFDDGPANDSITEIITSQTWTADNWYNMKDRVVVKPGATLTIEAGTVIASEGGTLAISRGAQIIAKGNKDAAIIFTSRDDLANWADDAGHPTGKNPRDRGTWRPGNSEWGSIGVLGRGRHADNRQNPSNPLGMNDVKETSLEGLVDLGDDSDKFGGLDDNDDSGVLKYVSLAYGGDVLGEGDELNGMSFGGVGRETDVSHIEILNNVDDGLEIFGGAVNVKCLLIWNIGDDSLDVDQGWRGKTQFTAIIQGFSENAGQGSGFADNANEMDGVDGDTTAQPQTTAVHWNMTVVGVPADLDNGTLDTSDGLMVFADNANVQFFNSIFMDSGGTVIENRGDDTDGSTGYGSGSTLSFADRWTTSYTHLHDPSLANMGAITVGELQNIYQAQVSGNLIQVAGALFYNNDDSSAYTEAIARGVVPGSTVGSENVALDNLIVGTSPVVSVVRADSSDGFPFFQTNGKETQGNIKSIDLRAAADALSSVRPMAFQPPEDGFYSSPTTFRGAVSPFADWMDGWTAIDAIRNEDGDTILASPEPPSTPDAELYLSPCVVFNAVKGCQYDIVRIAADDTETIIDTIVGDGTVQYVSDNENKPLDGSAKYEVRLVGVGH